MMYAMLAEYLSMLGGKMPTRTSAFFWKFSLAFILVFFVPATSYGFPQSTAVKSARKIAQDADGFIVLIQCGALAPSTPAESYPHLRYSGGSGVALSRDGYIITNEHVVREAKFCVVFFGGKKYPSVILGKDALTDLAVLKIAPDILRPAPFGDSGKVTRGDRVYVAGFPGGFNDTQLSLTQGIVSNTAVRIYSSPLFYYIGTDAQSYSGDSGGALINVNGEVVGITAQMPTGTSFSFFIPWNEAQSVVLRLQKGDIERGNIPGLALYDVFDIRGNLAIAAEAEKKGLTLAETVDAGSVVSDIFPDTTAARAGLMVNDVIVAVNGRPIRDHIGFFSAVFGSPPGTTVELTIIRRGVVQKILVITEKYAWQQGPALVPSQGSIGTP